MIALQPESCTSCMLCVRECPDWCITLDAHTEEKLIPGSARPRQHQVLDRFAIDFSLCMYCGICVEVCPFDALHWAPEAQYSEVGIAGLLHEQDRLSGWLPSVPTRPELDPNGESGRDSPGGRRQSRR